MNSFLLSTLYCGFGIFPVECYLPILLEACGEKFVLNFFFNLFYYLFLAALGLRCCAWAFSSCSEWGLLFVAARGLLIAVASLVVDHGL